MRLALAVASDPGGRGENEDNFYLAGRIKPEAGLTEPVSFQTQCADLPAVYAVCDGLGGLPLGEVASQTAVEELRRMADEVAGGTCPLDEAVRQIHRAVADSALSHHCRFGAVTVLARFTREGTVEICNVGDCRAFLFVDGALEQLSLDHTTARELEELGIVPKNGGKLTQHLGMDEDEYEIDPFLNTVPFPPKARLLLCSDGVTQRWGPAEIAEILAKSASAGVAADCLVKSTAPGQDNATAMVIERRAEE